MFYVVNLLTAGYALILYVMFRSAIYDWLRWERVSKSSLKKNRKGFGNYWFYRFFYRKQLPNHLYYLNVLFFASLALFLAAVIPFGYLDVMQRPIAYLSVVLWLSEVPCVVATTRIEAITQYGKSFVWWVKRKAGSHGYDSSVLTLSSALPPLLLMIGNIQEILAL